MDAVKICSSFTNASGKIVSGNAAILHGLKEYGGLERFGEMKKLEGAMELALGIIVPIAFDKFTNWLSRPRKLKCMKIIQKD